MHELDGGTLLTILGMTAISVITRCFFFISEREWTLPEWAERGLQYAPIAALTAVIAPDIVLINGELTAPWRDARVWAALVAGLFYFWRRGDSWALPASIGVGMLAFWPLRLGLGLGW